MEKLLFTSASTSISANDAKLEGVIYASFTMEGQTAGTSVQNVSLAAINFAKAACKKMGIKYSISSAS